MMRFMVMVRASKDSEAGELRQVFELSDFPPEVQEAASGETALRAQVEQRRRS